MPNITLATDSTAENKTTLLKRLQIRIELKAGKIMKLDMSIAPMSRIPMTTVTAVSSAISILYKEVRTPVAFEKLSSKVMANILL